MNEHQHKILSGIIITAVTFFGFETLSIIIGTNQVRAFQSTAIYLFLFHIFWIAFMFDLHLKRSVPVDLTSARFRYLLRRALISRFQHFANLHYFKHFANYFVLPTVLFWSAVVLMFLNPFNGQIKQIVILASTFAYALNYWHMKEHLSAKLEAHHSWLRLLEVAKLICVYQAYAAVIGFSWYFGLGSNLVFYFVLAGTYLLIRQALNSYGFHSMGLELFILSCSILVGIFGIWAYNNWTYQYFTAALVLLALYNTLWGFIHHYLEKTFTSKLALEYLILGLLVVSIIFATHNFGTRII